MFELLPLAVSVLQFWQYRFTEVVTDLLPPIHISMYWQLAVTTATQGIFGSLMLPAVGDAPAERPGASAPGSCSRPAEAQIQSLIASGALFEHRSGAGQGVGMIDCRADTGHYSGVV